MDTLFIVICSLMFCHLVVTFVILVLEVYKK